MTIICNDPTVVQGDRDRLAQMLWNLVENAIRYTDPGGNVTLGLHNHGSVAEPTVTDTGVGIPAEHLPHIFERFYRVERARSHQHGSTGLGSPSLSRRPRRTAARCACAASRVSAQLSLSPCPSPLAEPLTISSTPTVTDLLPWLHRNFILGAHDRSQSRAPVRGRRYWPDGPVEAKCPSLHISCRLTQVGSHAVWSKGICRSASPHNSIPAESTCSVLQ